MQVTQEHIKAFKAAYYNNTGDEADDPVEIALRAVFAQFPTTPPQSVSREEALDFLGTAARNWRRLPPLSEDDIGDVATALLWFCRKRTPPLQAEADVSDVDLGAFNLHHHRRYYLAQCVGNGDLGKHLTMLIADLDAPQAEGRFSAEIFRCDIADRLSRLICGGFKIGELRPIRIKDVLSDVMQIEKVSLHDWAPCSDTVSQTSQGDASFSQNRTEAPAPQPNVRVTDEAITFVRDFAKRDPVFAKGHEKGVIQRAKDIVAKIDMAPPQPDGLPQDVIDLVIAAREFWGPNFDLSWESRALDKALEAFSSRVPYENEPDDAEGSADV